jgi:Tfp pilus tip-associated adhesin PilY1
MKTPLPAIARTAIAWLFAVSASVHAAPIFTPNNMPTGWVGEVDVSAFDFTDGLQRIFKGDFIKGEWSGNLTSFPVDMDGTVLLDAANWSSVDNLDGQDWSTGRRIVTMKSDGTKIPFRFLSLSTTQAKDVDSSKSQPTSVIGPNIINHIRGDATNEKPNGTNLYRPRQHKLGDIIHSRPLFVDHATDPRVYVGGNDGMLHSFDADSGDEVFAYVPSFFISPVATSNFSNIKTLTVDPYVHNYFVDGTPNAATVSLSGGITKVLVGGLGAGGKGLYALNITDPTAADEAAAASKIMWEITPSTINNVATTSTTGYPDLGHTYGIPIIGKASDGSWVAIVGNGYNNQGSFQAVLYVINLADGSRKAAITATVTGTSNSNPNGLSSPTAVDVDHDGKIDYVYAGDINGNMWKFNLTSTTASSWTATKLYTTVPAQAITGRPAVSLHPLGGYMINFATGRMFTSADATDATTVYYAYGIRDNATTIADANIVSQPLTAKTWTASGGFNYNVRVSASNAVDYTATTPKQGWKIPLPAGERVVGDGGLVTNSRYVFASTNPAVAHAAISGVAQPQGDNWLNEVDFTTGGGGTSPVFDLDANLSLDDGDRVRDSGGTAAQAGATGIPVSRYIVSGVMSQPIVARLDKLSETYFNTNPDFHTVAGSSGGGGVSNGHFDFDIYYGVCTAGTTSYKCGHQVHVHQYDDKYNVTGVDMQNASLTSFNLVNAITSPSTKFRILVANQYLSPAVSLKMGASGATYVPSYNIETSGTPALDATTNAFRDSLPVYARGAGVSGATQLANLYLNMPLDAFVAKDWQGIGFTQVGLVPTVTGCVHASSYGFTDTGVTTLLPYGNLWMNGALTIQIIKDTTPDSAIRLESTPGNIKFGYRLKSDATSQTYQLAQYTIFWHHPNNKCYGQSGWGTTAAIAYPDSASSATASAIAPGSDDPTGGLFTGTGGGVGSTGTGGVSGPTSTITYTFADGSTVTQTTTQNLDGSVTVTRTYTDGTTNTFVIPPNSGGKQADTRAKTGRVSWREMIRP